MVPALFRLPLACVALLLLCMAGAAAKTGTQSEWTTDFGRLSLTVEDGQVVRGVYPDYQGRFVGAITYAGPEAVLDGVWIQPRSELRCPTTREGSPFWGLVRWVARADGSLSGQWSYCDRPLGSGGAWNGRQVSGTNPVETAPSEPGKTPLPQGQETRQPSPEQRQRPSIRQRYAETAAPSSGTNPDVGSMEVESHLRIQFGQTITREALYSFYADVTCDGSLDGVVGYLNRDHPDGPFFQVMIVTYARGDLESAVHTFAYQTEPPLGFCGPPEPPAMEVMTLDPSAALDLTGYGDPLCPTALRLADTACDALWLFYWPSTAPEPEFMLGHH